MQILKQKHQLVSVKYRLIKHLAWFLILIITSTLFNLYSKSMCHLQSTIYVLRASPEHVSSTILLRKTTYIRGNATPFTMFIETTQFVYLCQTDYFTNSALKIEKLRCGLQQLHFTRNYMGAWRT